MRVEQPPFRQQRVREGIADGAFDGLAELRSRHQERVNINTVRVQRQIRALDLLVIDGDEHEVDVGLFPDRVVRQAAAEDGGEDRAIIFHLLDERIKCFAELLLNRAVSHVRSPKHAAI